MSPGLPVSPGASGISSSSPPPRSEASDSFQNDGAEITSSSQVLSMFSQGQITLEKSSKLRELSVPALYRISFIHEVVNRFLMVFVALRRVESLGKGLDKISLNRHIQARSLLQPRAGITSQKRQSQAKQSVVLA